MSEEKGLTAEEVKTVRIGMEMYFKYAEGFITFQKIRTGQFTLTPEEEQIVPFVKVARDLLGMKDD